MSVFTPRKIPDAVRLNVATKGIKKGLESFKMPRHLFHMRKSTQPRRNDLSIYDVSFHNIKVLRIFSPRALHGSCRLKPVILMLFLFVTHNISCLLHSVPESHFATKIENFGQINENYYRGAQPKPDDLAALRKLGIRTVIDLQKDGSSRESSWVQDAGLKYFKIPLSNSRAATAEQTEYFLELVNNPAHWPVYVHCAGGRHRTGAMTAIYRMTHDSWTADQAYGEMKKYGFYSFPNHGSLKDYIYRYYRNYLETGGKRNGIAAPDPVLNPAPVAGANQPRASPLISRPKTAGYKKPEVRSQKPE